MINTSHFQYRPRYHLKTAIWLSAELLNELIDTRDDIQNAMQCSVYHKPYILKYVQIYTAN